MSFQSDLDSILDEIRVEAIHRYGMENSGVIEVSADQTRVIPANPATGNPEMQQDTEEMFQRDFETFLSHVEALRARFAEFYELETTTVALIRNRFGGMDFPDDVGDLRPGAINTVCERLHHADAQWVTPLAEPIEEADSPAFRFGYWSGAGATAFNNEFLAPFRAASERQIIYMRLLTFAAESFRLGIKGMQDDLEAIATACRDEMKSWREGGNPVVFFTVVGIVATAAGLFPGLSYAATAAFGTTSLAATFASMAVGSPPEREDEWPVEGDTAIAIIDSTYDAITHMLNEIGEEASDLARLLDQMADVSPGELTRPDVADSAAELGCVDSTDSTVVVAEVSEIYKAGYVNLPAAAAEYEAAYDDLYQHDIPESVDIAFPLARRPFTDARVNLAAALLSIGRSLRDAGATLVQVANTYQWTDDESATHFTQYRETVEPPPPPYHPHQRPPREILAGY